MRTTTCFALSACAAVLSSPASAQSLAALVNEAMQADIRTSAETARDANRKPLETLEFFGLEPDRRVLELVPAGGWYTKILAPVLRDEGQLYVAILTDTIAELEARHEALREVEIIDTGSAYPFSYQTDAEFVAEPRSLGVAGLDMVLTFRNLHNFTPEVRRYLNEAVYEALAPGGIYGVVDHTRRHMEPTSRENGRRVDPVLAIKELEDVGFEFEDYSTLHYRPVDELDLEVGHDDVTGRTDRFTMRFRKPVDAD